MCIVQKIEDIRREMIDLGMEKGLKDEQVIQLSQMLDELINKYYQFSYIRPSNQNQPVSQPDNAITNK